MGQGGNIVLLNGTNSNWIRTNQQSSQMNSWNFPEKILAGTSATIYVEWNEGFFSNSGDDSGDVTYMLEGSQNNFQVQARANGGFHLQVVLQNISTAGNPVGAIIGLGWVHDGHVEFILSGSPGKYTGNNLPTAWMQNNLGMLGRRNLRNLCMPGSHDSGMSVSQNGTAFGFACNTKTQVNGILGQLQLGARYFDIRPIIGGGQYFTGHYTEVGPSWQGARGQSMQAVINDVNAYTQTNKELVVLYFSHALNTDQGNGSYRSFNQGEWDALFALMQGGNGLKNLFITNNPADLTLLALNEFIGAQQAAVVVVVDATDISLGQYANKGFYTRSQFPVFNSYTKSNDVDKMANDQFTKMKDQKKSPDNSYFLLSWTLTQDDTQAATCSLPGVSSILDLAANANPQIYRRLMGACTPQSYPNILYIDSVDTANIAALAMAINTVYGQG